MQKNAAGPASRKQVSRLDRETEGLSKYLTFVLDEERFGAAIDSVREILEVGAVVHIPGTPDHLYGAINLRGAAVPVIDLRRKFGMRAKERTVDTRIIIMEIAFDGERALVGALADAVEEVFELEPGESKDAPRIGTCIKPEFIRGIASLHDRFVHVLDLTTLFSRQELATAAS
ncbi:MAG: chemotaxis protein CheW [Desulfovibrionaceae bacterium]